MHLEYATRALIDMDEHTDHIRLNSPRSALRFLEAVEKTGLRLLTFPEFGAAYESPDPDVEGLRVCQLSGFPNHLMFYRILGEKIRIDRILHGSRDIPHALKEGT